MSASLSVLTSNLFDYAGMYPPTSLDLAAAFANYLRYQKGDQAAMCNRFVCPAGSLNELAFMMMDQAQGDLKITVTSADELEADYQAVTTFEETVGDQATVYGFEFRLKEDISTTDQISYFSGDAGMDEFLEIPWSAEIPEAVAAIAERDGPYAKVRCGGAYIPTALEIAMFLKSAISLDVPFKLTAGLHHAFRTSEAHGFLNVLIAAALIYEEEISASQAAQVIEETKTLSLFFDEDEAGWKDIRVPIESLQEVRSLFLNIGSCSIDEPYEDLKFLGLP